MSSLELKIHNDCNADIGAANHGHSQHAQTNRQTDSQREKQTYQ